MLQIAALEEAAQQHGKMGEADKAAERTAQSQQKRQELAQALQEARAHPEHQRVLSWQARELPSR